MVSTSVNVLTVLALTLTATQSQKVTPVLLIELNRHGARAPITRLTGVIKSTWIEKTGKGELSPVGQRQRYYLGKNMFYKYPEIFKKGLNNSEFYIRSTDYNRTIMSAFSQVFGLRNGSSEFTDKALIFGNDDPRIKPPQDLLFDTASIDFDTPLIKGFRPFPIHSEIEIADLLLGADSTPCPKNLKAQTDFQTKMGKELLEKSKSMKQAIEDAIKIYGIEEATKDWNRDFHLCYQFGDFVIQDYWNNPNPTVKPDSDLYKKLANCYFLGIAVLAQPGSVTKSSQTPLLNQIVTYFQKKIDSFNEGKFSYLKKYIQYSAHDDTLSVHLTYLGLLDYECLLKQVMQGVDIPDCKRTPEVASNIIWELLQIENSEVINGKMFLKQSPMKYGVRVSYNGEYLNYCDQDDPKKANYICPFDDFVKRIQNKMTVPDIKKHCGLVASKQNNSLLWVVIVIFGVLLALNLFVVIALISLKKKIGVAMKMENEGEGFGEDEYLKEKSDE